MLSLLHFLVLLNCPALALREAAVLALEHLCGLLVALQLPIEPAECNNGELAAMRLPIGATVTHGIIRCTGRHVVNPMEVVHAVLVGDVLLAAKDVDDWRVNLLQLRLLGHRHSTFCLSSVAVLEEAAVANHQRLDARVGTVIKCLQPAARHSCCANVLHIYLIIIR